MLNLLLKQHVSAFALDHHQVSMFLLPTQSISPHYNPTSLIVYLYLSLLTISIIILAYFDNNQ